MPVTFVPMTRELAFRMSFFLVWWKKERRSP